MRAIARARGVAQVRDNASREKVLAMVTDIRKKPLEREDRQKLEDAVSAYLASFPGVLDYVIPAGAGDDASGSSASGFRVRGRSQGAAEEGLQVVAAGAEAQVFQG